MRGGTRSNNFKKSLNVRRVHTTTEVVFSRSCRWRHRNVRLYNYNSNNTTLSSIYIYHRPAFFYRPPRAIEDSLTTTLTPCTPIRTRYTHVLYIFTPGVLLRYYVLCNVSLSRTRRVYTPTTVACSM